MTARERGGIDRAAMAALLDSLVDPVLLAGRDHRILYMNRAAANHYSEGESLLGGSLLDCHNERSRSVIADVMDAFLAGREEERLITDDGKRRIWMRAVRDESGNLVGYYERYAPPAAGGGERSASGWIARLGLEPHPEGGYFRETWRAAESIGGGALPERFSGERAHGSAILFLIGPGQCSRLHRLAADETWHHYDGGDLAIHILHPDRRHEEIRIGPAAERFQATVPSGVWFGAAPVDPGAFALTGCTLAPGFHFDDFEMGNRPALLERYPEHAAIIEKLTP